MDDRSFKHVGMRDLIVLAACTVFLFGAYVYGTDREPLASAETQFVEMSDSGLDIVPASCETGTPHNGENCSLSCDGAGCGGYSQGSYGPAYSQSGYYAQSSYYSQGAYCSATYYCSGNDLFYRNAQCGEAFVQNCAWGCSGGGCLPPPPPQGNITADPVLIRSGNTSVISWTTQYTSSCSVTENIAEINDTWNGTSGSKTSSGLVQQTVYTLRCTGLDGSQFTDAVTVNIIPIFEEQ